MQRLIECGFDEVLPCIKLQVIEEFQDLVSCRVDLGVTWFPDGAAVAELLEIDPLGQQVHVLLGEAVSAHLLRDLECAVAGVQRLPG